MQGHPERSGNTGTVIPRPPHLSPRPPSSLSSSLPTDRLQIGQPPGQSRMEQGEDGNVEGGWKTSGTARNFLNSEGPKCDKVSVECQ